MCVVHVCYDLGMSVLCPSSLSWFYPTGSNCFAVVVPIDPLQKYLSTPEALPILATRCRWAQCCFPERLGMSSKGGSTIGLLFVVEPCPSRTSATATCSRMETRAPRRSRGQARRHPVWVQHWVPLLSRLARSRIARMGSIPKKGCACDTCVSLRP